MISAMYVCSNWRLNDEEANSGVVSGKPVSFQRFI